jgi:hypothetical protein
MPTSRSKSHHTSRNPKSPRRITLETGYIFVGLAVLFYALTGSTWRASALLFVGVPMLTLVFWLRHRHGRPLPRPIIILNVVAITLGLAMLMHLLPTRAPHPGRNAGSGSLDYAPPANTPAPTPTPTPGLQGRLAAWDARFPVGSTLNVYEPTPDMPNDSWRRLVNRWLHDLVVSESDTSLAYAVLDNNSGLAPTNASESGTAFIDTGDWTSGNAGDAVRVFHGQVYTATGPPAPHTVRFRYITDPAGRAHILVSLQD